MMAYFHALVTWCQSFKIVFQCAKYVKLIAVNSKHVCYCATICLKLHDISLVWLHHSYTFNAKIYIF